MIVTGYGPEEGCDEVDAWIEKQDLFPALLDKIKQLVGEGEPEAIKSA